MKKTIALLLCILLLAAAPLALADSDATLTVSGTGVVTLTPDYATLTLGVGTQATTVTEAQEQNAAQMTSLIAALRAAGIAEEDMQTSYFSINPIYDYNSFSNGSQAIQGYQVDNSLLVTIRDLGGISKVLDEAMKAGANQSYGLSFESSKKNEAYDQAMQNAAAEGTRKAGVLAGASGKTLGDLEKVEEQTSGYRGEYVTASKMMDAGTSTPIMTGTLTVEATVVMTFALK